MQVNNLYSHLFLIILIFPPLRIERDYHLQNFKSGFKKIIDKMKKWYKSELLVQIYTTHHLRKMGQ